MNDEAETLRKLFEDLQSKGGQRKKFADDFGVPGGGAMVYQHVTGRRPISLEAAICYAIGFNRPLEEISQRLAGMLAKLPKASKPAPLYMSDVPAIPYSNNVSELPQKADPDIAEVTRLMDRSDARGRAMALAAVKVALAGHTTDKSKQRAS
jgi:hypothetical protein